MHTSELVDSIFQPKPAVQVAPAGACEIGLMLLALVQAS